MLILERRLGRMIEINDKVNCSGCTACYAVCPQSAIEMKLDEADRQAAGTDERLSHESVFKNARSAIHGK